jgi:hypothetical protein
MNRSSQLYIWRNKTLLNQEKFFLFFSYNKKGRELVCMVKIEPPALTDELNV